MDYLIHVGDVVLGLCASRSYGASDHRCLGDGLLVEEGEHVFIRSVVTNRKHKIGLDILKDPVSNTTFIDLVRHDLMGRVELCE
jgi:hypothetical protein